MKFLTLFVCLFALKGALQAAEPPAGYILGSNDQVKIDIVELEEFTGRTYRIDQDGTISVPLAGRIVIAGMTLGEAERKIAAALGTQINDPHVSITLLDSKSQPVSIMGEVNSPGVHQLERATTLYEVLALAGGLKADAGNLTKITRRLRWGPIPVADAKTDEIHGVSVAEVKTSDIQSGNPSADIRIFPDDIITVPRADVVYVVGEVRKAGEIVLREKSSISVTEALSAAEGMQNSASPGNARILRPIPGATTRAEIRVDLRKVLEGKGEDMTLRPNDVLYVPNSASKRAITRAAEIGLMTVSGVIIYR